MLERFGEWFSRWRPKPRRAADAPNTESRDFSLYSGDEPIRTATEDRLDRSRFVQGVVDMTVSRRERAGLVIGIYGAWGEGKTSLMRMIEAQLRDRAHLIPFWFNPWYFRNEEHLIEVFFHSLAGAIGKRLGSSGQRLGELLMDYGSLLEWLPNVGGPMSRAAGSIGKKLASTTLDDLRSRVENCLGEIGKRVVVFVDDLDRLDRTEIQAVVKLVKLTAGFDYMTYVLAFDDQVVSSALGERYGEGGQESGRGFLEKIIQLPLRLPAVDPTVLLSLTLESISGVLQSTDVSLTEEQVREFRRYFDDMFGARVRTPRAGKRYSNALAFGLPILKGEIHPVDLMLMETIRVFYPDIYTHVRPNRDLFLGRRGTPSRSDQEGNRQSWNKMITGLTTRESTAIQDCLTYLFPRFRSTTANYEFGSEWDQKWDKEQRVASASYFDRYFQLGIPFDDVSDVELGQLRHLLDVGATDQAEPEFRRLARSHSVDRLLAKLRSDEKAYSVVAARTLIGVLVRVGEILPERDQGLSSFTAPAPQAAILMRHLLKLLPPGEREGVALVVARAAQPLSFALECYSWMKSSAEERHGDSVVLGAATESVLESTLLNRIREQSTSSSLMDLTPSQVRTILHAWVDFGDKAETEAYLKKMFESNSTYAARFVTFFLPSSWSMETGLPLNAPLTRSGYDAISRLIDPTLVFNMLRKVYGPELDAPEYMEGLVSTARERAAAHQFAFIHQQVTSVKTESGAAETKTDSPEKGSGPKSEST